MYHYNPFYVQLYNTKACLGSFQRTQTPSLSLPFCEQQTGKFIHKRIMQDSPNASRSVLLIRRSFGISSLGVAGWSVFGPAGCKNSYCSKAQTLRESYKKFKQQIMKSLELRFRSRIQDKEKLLTQCRHHKCFLVFYV